MIDQRGVERRPGRGIAVWARRHVPVFIVTSTALVAALIVLATLLMQLPGQSDSMVSALVLVVLVLLVLSVFLPVAGHRVQQRERSDEQAEQRRERIDRLLAAGSCRHLPRLSELAADALGETETRYTRSGDAPYVARTGHDEAIRALLGSAGPPYPFVIVWGTTKAGKSRTLAEAVRAVLIHDPLVVISHGGQGMAELTHLGLTVPVAQRPALVLLDDLTPADLQALTAPVLTALTDWAIIAATITAERRNDILKTGSEVGASARLALNRAVTYELPFTATPTETADAQRLYPDEHFTASIAETLVGGRELITRYRASPDTDPAGCAILRAAIDCRRAGLARPVTEPELRRLFPLYLQAVRIGLPPTAALFATGLAWATSPVTSQVALLTPTDPDRQPARWRVLDHAVTADEGHDHHQPRPIPAELWSELTDVIPPSDAYKVGFTAYTRNETTAAITAFRKVCDNPNSNEAPQAMFGMGILLKQQGEVDRARAAYQQAIDSGHPDHSPAAMLNLGVLLAEKGEAGGARVAYQQAIDSGHPDHSPAAMLNLGVLLAEQGEVDGARAAYQQAIDSGHPDQASKAMVNLGILLKRQGEVDGARAVYQQAIDSGHPDKAPKATVNLGFLLAGQGEVDGAQAAYQQAIDSGHPEAAPLAQGQLDDLNPWDS